MRKPPISNTAPQPLLTLQQEQVYYRDQLVLENIDLAIYSGERIAILGKSGAGKSTLLKLIYRQLSAQPSPQRLGWIPQQLGLVDNLSVFHNVYMGRLGQHATLYNLLNLLWPQKTPRQAIADHLTTLELSAELFKTVGELSGGQQQRVAVARALYSQPDIIIADEPASNLDAPMTHRVINELLRHSQSTIIALHDTALALQFADRVIGIQQGRIVLNQPACELSCQQLTPLFHCD